MFVVLGVVLPVALVAGIAARKPAPAPVALPRELSSESPRFEVTRWSRGDLFTKAPVRVVLVRERADAGRFAVELSAPTDFAKPDLLVYWAAGNATVADTIPDNAVFLGSFSVATPLFLPSGAASSGGVLILYSLADQEVVGVSKPLTF